MGKGRVPDAVWEASGFWSNARKVIVHDEARIDRLLNLIWLSSRLKSPPFGEHGVVVDAAHHTT
jgi:hypothetical protein